MVVLAEESTGKTRSLVMGLQNFNFDVVYKSGKKKVVPHCLSLATSNLDALEVDLIEAHQPGGTA